MGPLHSLHLGDVSEDSVWSQVDALREVRIERNKRLRFFSSMTQTEIKNYPPTSKKKLGKVGNYLPYVKAS